MKKRFKKITAVLLSAVLLLSLLSAAPAAVSANDQNGAFKVIAASNFFPEAQRSYSDLSQFEDENGDVFITVEYRLCALDMYLVNIQLDELTWDPAVLEFKEAYNILGKGRNARFVFFPFSYEQGRGSGIVNTFGDNNGGRIVANYSGIMPSAYAYNEDGSPITVIKIVFKLLDRTAASTTVNCAVDVMSFNAENEGNYSDDIVAIFDGIPNEELSDDVFTCYTSVSPAVDCDINGDGTVTVQDATDMLGVLAEFESSPYDLRDPGFVAVGDANSDGKINVLDVTDIQRYLAGVITEL